MTDNQPTKAYNDQNVYILGAGFSAEAGLPLIKDFMNRMRDAAAWLAEQGECEREVKAIEGRNVGVIYIRINSPELAIERVHQSGLRRDPMGGLSCYLI